MCLSLSKINTTIMELKFTSKHLLKVLYVLSWVIFIGLCIEVGGILFNGFYALVINPIAAEQFWNGLNLSSLYQFDKGYFITEIVQMTIVTTMQAILFYLIVSIIHNKKLDLSQPFNNELKRFVFNVSYMAIGIAVFSYWGVKNTEWLISKGVSMPNIQKLGFGGADVWLFMGITLLVIAQIIKRGVEIQEENDLTI